MVQFGGEIEEGTALVMFLLMVVFVVVFMLVVRRHRGYVTEHYSVLTVYCGTLYQVFLSTWCLDGIGNPLPYVPGWHLCGMVAW